MDLLLRNSIKKTPVYDTYWHFAYERQNIFWNKYYQKNITTTDEILSKYKFTNAYRVNDRVSQFLLKNVIYDGKHKEEDLLFRILLFKIFNKIETWQGISEILGEISYSTFDTVRYKKAFEELSSKKKIYSGAYIMPSGKSQFGHTIKYENHLDLLHYMMNDKLLSKIKKCHSLEDLYNILLTYPSLGRFLAFQYSIDINYSDLTDFDEMEFVVAGPGACSGIEKCFYDTGSYSKEDIIKYMTWHQQEEFEKRNLHFVNLGGRDLQLIDCQNLFCETDKYARVKHPEFADKKGRKRIKQLYRPNDTRIQFMYPPKWKIVINE